MNVRLHLPLLLAAALLVLRCDGANSSDSTTDAGVTTDASDASFDAGHQVDAGQPDAGSADAGGTVDAGESADAGVIDGTQLTATLDGTQVVPPVTTNATGTATLVIDSTRQKLTYSITHDVVNASAVEIWLGVSGQKGAFAFSLQPVSPSMSGTISIAKVQASQLEQGNWYLVVNSPMFPGGEIRGQIEKAP